MAKTRVCIGRFLLAHYAADWLTDIARLNLFVSNKPEIIEWCEDYISGFNLDRLKVISTTSADYENIEVWMLVDTVSDLTLWKLRPEWEQNEYV